MPKQPHLPRATDLGHGSSVANPSEPERELEPIGEARRFAWADGRERWHLPETRAADAELLETLGRAGIGGFAASGTDEQGIWLVRRRAETKLAALLGTHENQPLSWRPCVDLVASLAAALAAAEAAEVFPGVLRPQLESLVANLDQTIGQVAEFVAPENAKNVARILENLGAMSEETQRLVVGLDETRENLDVVVGRLDQLLAANDDDIRTAVSDLQQAIEALARRSEAVASNLEDATRNANEFSRQLRANPGVLLRGRETGPGGER